MAAPPTQPDVPPGQNLLALLRCPVCRGTLSGDGEVELHCAGCRRVLPVRDRVIDALGEVSPEVIREIEGMMTEHRHAGRTVDPDWRNFVVRRIGRNSTLAEREAALGDGPRNYYRSTRLNVEHAISRIDLSGKRTAVEIGGTDEFPFLRPLADRGLACCAVNIHFEQDEARRASDWPLRVAGDMNRLPLADGAFDVVMASATTHHSPDLAATIREMSRVAASGAYVLILNEPSGAVLKHWWDRLSGRREFRQGGGRTDEIHENEYALSLYRRLLHENGLRLQESFLSRFYADRLSSGQTAGVRWAPVAALAGRLWRVPPFRRWLDGGGGLALGQRLIGLEINLIARKT